MAVLKVVHLVESWVALMAANLAAGLVFQWVAHLVANLVGQTAEWMEHCLVGPMAALMVVQKAD